MPRLCPRHGVRQSRAPGAMLGRRASRLAPPLPTRITLGHGEMRRDGDIAPYRHYTRQIRTRITHAHYSGGAMGTSRPTAITRFHYTRKIRRAIPHAMQREKEHKGGEPHCFMVFKARPLETLKNLYGFLPMGVMVFVLLYIPLKRSLCPFVLKNIAPRATTRDGSPPSRLASPRHCPPGLPAAPYRPCPVAVRPRRASRLDGL